MIEIDITYRLNVIVNFVNRLINHKNNDKQIRIVMIVIDRHFVMHFRFLHTSNKFILSINVNESKYLSKRRFFETLKTYILSLLLFSRFFSLIDNV